MKKQKSNVKNLTKEEKLKRKELKIIDEWWGAIQNIQNKNRHIGEWTQFKFACLSDLVNTEKNTIKNEPKFFYEKK